MVLYYERGNYPRGHDIPCKYCGFKSAEHQCDEVEKTDVVQKGFKISLRTCAEEEGGYEPKDKKTWRAREKTDD